jgi:steroid 5-alpha reductase family enzyme
VKQVNKQSGQTLVALLVFMATALIITTGAVAVTIANLQSASEYSRGEQALQVAESGADNALLRLTRDPSYTGETLTVGTGTATITVSGSPSYTITSVGRVGDFRRTIQVTATRSNNVVTQTAWSEVP